MKRLQRTLHRTFSTSSARGNTRGSASLVNRAHATCAIRSSAPNAAAGMRGWMGKMRAWAARARAGRG